MSPTITPFKGPPNSWKQRDRIRGHGLSRSAESEQRVGHSSELKKRVQTFCSYTPQCTSIQGLVVSIRWYLGFLERPLGGAGCGCFVYNLAPFAKDLLGSTPPKSFRRDQKTAGRRQAEQLAAVFELASAGQ